VEDRQPSFLLGGRLLVTGEVARPTDSETDLPPAHQAWWDGAWAHDPAVHEDKAAVLHVRDRGLVILTGGHAVMTAPVNARLRSGPIWSRRLICTSWCAHLRSSTPCRTRARRMPSGAGST
jgi:hypothetical protein